MNRTGRKIAKSFFVLYLLSLHAVVGFFLYEKYGKSVLSVQPVDPSAVTEPAGDESLTAPIPLPTFSESLPANYGENTSSNSGRIFLPDEETPPDALFIPVVGIKRDQLTDTYTNARGENRVHNAIDIIAPQGTPVIATADGEIAKFFDSERGGITIYQYNADKTLIYYYAHLQRRADNISEKQYVKRGTVIGYVGDTGNAGAGNFHLHFSIAKISSPERYFDGENINPFPMLQKGIETK